MIKVKELLQKIKKSKTYIILIKFVNLFCYNVKSKYYPFVVNLFKPSMKEIMKKNWYEYLKRKDNIILAIALTFMVFTFFPSCKISFNGETDYKFYNSKCELNEAWVDKINRKTYAWASYSWINLTVLSLIFLLTSTFILKYLVEEKIRDRKNKRKRLE